jgi:aryl-alcohol dehydrogenase-like predicted oxidoreductase
LYQLHNPKLELISEGRVFKTLEALKQEGKIRFWGVSIHVAREGAAVIQEGSSDAIQAVYNLIDQRICREMMPLCEEHEIGLIIREPLYSGFLSGKYTLASEFEKIDHRRRWTREKRESDFKKIRRIQTAFDESKVSLKQAAMEFVLSEKAVSVVIPGIKTVTQLEDHLRAVHEPKLSKTEIQQLKSIFNTEELFQTGFHRN